MSGLSFVERLAALDKPDEGNDTEQIWFIVRTFLGILRVLIFVSIIVIAEMLEEIFIGNHSRVAVITHLLHVRFERYSASMWHNIGWVDE